MGVITRTILGATGAASRVARKPTKAVASAGSPALVEERSIAQADSSLLAAVRDGDRGALAALIEQHQRAIFGYLRARVLEPSDAEDLCQEVFLRCYLGRVRCDSAAPIRPWLLGVARNVLREHLKGRVRKREVAWSELCLEVETMISPIPGMYDDAMEHLPACLEGLGPSARQALEMHYRDEQKLAFISEKLRRSLGAVKLLLYRARQALRHCLQEKLARAAAVER